MEKIIFKGSDGLSRKIDQDLIDLCEERSKNDGDTYLIFDREDSLNIKSSVDESRNIKIEKILDCGLFIGNIEEFADYLSRWSYYDTITKTTNQSLRYHIAYQFITNLGVFKKKDFLDPTRPVIFEYEGVSGSNVRLTLNPNLIIEISTRSESNIFTSNGGKNKRFNGSNFYNPKWIRESIIYALSDNKEEVRSLKINGIISQLS